jgi:hypothetical protein
MDFGWKIPHAGGGRPDRASLQKSFSRPDVFSMEELPSTVGTPGLGVRQPDGKSAGWEISNGWKIGRMGNL